MCKYIRLFVLILSLSWAQPSLSQNLKVATFAAGCFWCAQQFFDEVPGVEYTIVGYSGGSESKPSYKDVAAGKTGHIESIQVYYNPEVTDYQKLVKAFWLNVDPMVKAQQFCDVGYQYSAAIFIHNQQQELVANQSKLFVEDLLGVNHALILPFKSFHPAESYHQNYYKKNPIRYNYYKHGCGRTKRLNNIWPPQLKNDLTNYLVPKTSR